MYFSIIFLDIHSFKLHKHQFTLHGFQTSENHCVKQSGKEHDCTDIWNASKIPFCQAFIIYHTLQIQTYVILLHAKVSCQETREIMWLFGASEHIWGHARSLWNRAEWEECMGFSKKNKVRSEDAFMIESSAVGIWNRWQTQRFSL